MPSTIERVWVDGAVVKKGTFCTMNCSPDGFIPPNALELSIQRLVKVVPWCLDVRGIKEAVQVSVIEERRYTQPCLSLGFNMISARVTYYFKNCPQRGLIGCQIRILYDNNCRQRNDGVPWCVKCFAILRDNPLNVDKRNTCRGRDRARCGSIKGVRYCKWCASGKCSCKVLSRWVSDFAKDLRLNNFRRWYIALELRQKDATK